MKPRCAFIIFIAFGHSAFALTQPDVLRTVNATRQTCGARAENLKLNEALSQAASYMQRGDNMQAALERASYRADQSSVIRLRGKLDNKSLERLLKDNYCDTLKDKALTNIGIVANEREAYILLAKPFTPPKTQDRAKVAQQVLQLANEARAKPRRCGSKRFAAAAPLTLNDTLTRAALAHSQDMAKRGHASHDGSDGSSPGDRATRAGYKWRTVGENVAAGQLDADEVMRGWLSSPHHCENVMAAEFTELGVAFAVNPQAAQGIYWTQVFGKPR